MREALTHWNQYGFATDVFDRYRDSVKRSNRDAIRVLSCMSVFAGLAAVVFGFVTKQKLPGLCFCLLVLAAGTAGTVVSFRETSSRRQLLVTGYILSVSVYLLAIYASYTFRTDAFWIGTQIAVGCYLFDYAWRVGGLQLLSCAGLCLSWTVTPGTEVTGSRLLFCGLFLVVGLVTFYTLNRTRASLILSRETTVESSEEDRLTGLTARIAAQKEIEEHLKTEDHGAMMLMNLDRFRSVNDRLGHQIGDKVLADVASDLKKMFRNSDILSRLDGDEFMVYLKSVPEEDWAVQRAEQMVRQTRRWAGNGTTNIQVTASVGIVMTDVAVRNYDDLYRAAAIAMYTAKHEGGNKAMVYSPEMLDNPETSEGSVRTEAPGRDGKTEDAAG